MNFISLSSLLLIIGLANLSNGQTFQYSRGWTNGKRGNMDDVDFFAIPKQNGRLSHNSNVKLPCDPQCGSLIILTKNKKENFNDEFPIEQNNEPIMDTRYKRGLSKM